MADIITILMDCNKKKTCSKFINASIPKRILEFIANNKSDTNLLQKLFQTLSTFYNLSSKSTLNQLEDNNYLTVINPIDIKIKYKLLHAINPHSVSSQTSVSPSMEEKTIEPCHNTTTSPTDSVTEKEIKSHEKQSNDSLELEQIDETMIADLDISEQENDDQDTEIVEDFETTEDEQSQPPISPQKRPRQLQSPTPKENVLSPQPPHATAAPPVKPIPSPSILNRSGSNSMTPIQVLESIENKVNSLNRQRSASKTKTDAPRSTIGDGSEMELVLDAISDIQSTIMNLQQQTLDMKTPQMIKKYVVEHHAPRYSGIEQQKLIDTETERIVKFYVHDTTNFNHV